MSLAQGLKLMSFLDSLGVDGPEVQAAGKELFRGAVISLQLGAVVDLRQFHLMSFPSIDDESDASLGCCERSRRCHSPATKR